MQFEKLFRPDVLTGVVIGALVGLYHPLDAYKTILIILGVVLGLKLVTSK